MSVITIFSAAFKKSRQTLSLVQSGGSVYI